MINQEIASVCIKRSDSLISFLCYYASDAQEPNLNIFNKLFGLKDNDAIELVDYWKKHRSEKKFTVRIVPGVDGYLNVRWEPLDLIVGNLNEFGGWHSELTDREINMLKQRDDIAIDWDKAVIEPVEDD